MQEPLLTAWDNFYVIVGSSAAALTGLQFVVIALVADSHIKSNTTTIDAFGTPTIVHFCAVLLLSAVLSAPWSRLGGPAHIIGAMGILGLIYTVVVTRRANRQSGYKPVFEDWLWHIILPFVAYGTLVVAHFVLAQHDGDALFIIATAALLLLFIGIHNAWDSVTYIALTRAKQPGETATASGEQGGAPETQTSSPDQPSTPPDAA